jgi:hypothetical protein
MMPRRRQIGTALALLRLFPAYLAFAIFKHALALPRLARLAWRQPRGGTNADRRTRAIARVVRMRQLVPIADGDCLQKSLLLYRELSREGADPVLLVGFRSVDGMVQGHAWVEVDGKAIADDAEDGGPFTPALRFGSGGHIISAKTGTPDASANDSRGRTGVAGSERNVLFAAVLMCFVFVAIRAWTMGGPPVVMSYLSMFSCFGYAGIICPLLYASSWRRRAILIAVTGGVAALAAVILAAAGMATPVNLAKSLLLSAGAVGAGAYLRPVLRAGTRDRGAALAAARDAAILPLAIVQVTFFLWPQIAINPVYDAYVLAFEQLMGLHFEREIVGFYRWTHPASALATGAYLALPVGLAMVALTQPSSARKSRVLVAFLATGAVGFLLYYICPAVGPTQAFSTLYPVPLPVLSLHEIVPIWTPGHVPRNGMPSLHAVWIVLILLNMRHMGRAWRAALVLFGVLNLGAAVGRYEHWLLDLVVSVPMASALQLAFVGGGTLSPVSRWGRAGVCGVLTVGWLTALRTGALVTMPEWTAWAAVFLTLGTIGFAASRDAGRAPLPQQGTAPAAG